MAGCGQSSFPSSGTYLPHDAINYVDVNVDVTAAKDTKKFGADAGVAADGTQLSLDATSTDGTNLSTDSSYAEISKAPLPAPDTKLNTNAIVSKSPCFNGQFVSGLQAVPNTTVPTFIGVCGSYSGTEHKLFETKIINGALSTIIIDKVSGRTDAITLKSASELFAPFENTGGAKNTDNTTQWGVARITNINGAEASITKMLMPTANIKGQQFNLNQLKGAALLNGRLLVTASNYTAENNLPGILAVWSDSSNLKNLPQYSQTSKMNPTTLGVVTVNGNEYGAVVNSLPFGVTGTGSIDLYSPDTESLSKHMDIPASLGIGARLAVDPSHTDRILLGSADNSGKYYVINLSNPKAEASCANAAKGGIGCEIHTLPNTVPGKFENFINVTGFSPSGNRAYIGRTKGDVTVVGGHTMWKAQQTITPGSATQQLSICDYSTAGLMCAAGDSLKFYAAQ